MAASHAEQLRGYATDMEAYNKRLLATAVVQADVELMRDYLALKGLADARRFLESHARFVRRPVAGAVAAFVESQRVKADRARSGRSGVDGEAVRSLHMWYTLQRVLDGVVEAVVRLGGACILRIRSGCAD